MQYPMFVLRKKYHKNQKSICIEKNAFLTNFDLKLLVLYF